MNISELSDLLNTLSNEDKKTLLNLLKHEAREQSDNKEIALNRPICCPVCGKVERVVKNGRRGYTQRYLCRQCNKSFVANTNTILERTHKPLATWKKFIECMVHGMSILKSAELCQINKNTAFAWRHKILDALSHISKDTNLEGIVEADETFFVLSYKGQKQGLPRLAKKRATPAKKRGLSSEQVCVPCGIDRNGNTVSKMGNLGKVSQKGLKRVLGGRIKSKSVLCTDRASAYRKFSEDNELQLVQLKGGKEKLGVYHINHINAYHSSLKTFLRPFRGVATKYLDNYLTWNIYTSRQGKLQEKTQSMFTDMCQANIVVRFDKIADRPSVPVA